MGAGEDPRVLEPSLRAALDAAAEGWAVGTPVYHGGRIVDFRLHFFNQAGADALHLDRERLLGRRYSELWPNLVTSGLLDAFATVYHSGEPLTRTFYYEAEQGPGGYFRIHAERMGASIGVRFANFSEGTIDRPTSSGEVLLRAALDAAFDGFALLTGVRDAGGKLIDFDFYYVNEVGAKLGGKALSDMVGCRVSDVWPAMATSGLLARYTAAAESGETYLIEYVDPALGSVWELKATRIAADVLALSYRDITLRVRQQEQIAQSETQARQAVGRIAALQAVTASLTGAVGVTDVVDVMQREILASTEADGLMVLLREDNRLLVRHNTAYLPNHGQQPPQEFDIDGPSAVAGAVRERRALFFGSRHEFLAEFPATEASVRESDKHSWSMLPLVSTGQVIGAMIISYGAPRTFTRDDREAQIVLSGLCAQALERALLYEAQKSIAAELQRALLPATMPALDGARCAARYIPWTHGADVGGDWYDLIELGPSCVALVIGDVAGHSINAAATMGQIRSAIRAYALEGLSPTGVMQRVNRLVTRLDPGVLATCCYLELHLDEGSLTAVLAGHPPPILRTGAGVGPVELRVGVPLGVAQTEYLDTTLLLPESSTLLLYTDGLVEDRRYPIDQGMSDLCRMIATAPDLDPDALADWVLSSDAWPHQRSDDVALLAISVERRSGRQHPPRAARDFSGDASSAASARRFAADVLAAWGLESLVDTARLLLGEVITNAVQHTVGDVRVCLIYAGATLRVEVSDHSNRRPDPRPMDLEAEDGRGLYIVQSLADRWGHESVDAGGKTVWFELRVLPPNTVHSGQSGTGQRDG